MYHELLERLAIILAKTEGWEIEDGGLLLG
jgi:hypothetical protein